MHIGLRLLELVQQGKIFLHPVATDKLLEDIFTKYVNRVSFNTLISMIQYFSAWGNVNYINNSGSSQEIQEGG